MFIFSESPKMGEKGSVWPQVLGAFGGNVLYSLLGMLVGFLF